MSKDYGQDCPLAKTAEIIAERWTPLILRQLFAGRSRFSHFETDLPGISPRLLADRLKTLEAHGVVERTVSRGCPPRVDYQLTEAGRALRVLALAMSDWGVRYCPDARPVQLTHGACGGLARLEMRCADCGSSLAAEDVLMRPRAGDRPL